MHNNPVRYVDPTGYIHAEGTTSSNNDTVAVTVMIDTSSGDRETVVSHVSGEDAKVQRDNPQRVRTNGWVDNGDGTFTIQEGGTRSGLATYLYNDATLYGGIQPVGCDSFDNFAIPIGTTFRDSGLDMSNFELTSKEVDLDPSTNSLSPSQKRSVSDEYFRSFGSVAAAEMAGLGALHIGAGVAAMAGYTSTGFGIAYTGVTAAGMIGGGIFVVVGTGIVIVAYDLGEGNGLDLIEGVFQQ